MFNQIHFHLLFGYSSIAGKGLLPLQGDAKLLQHFFFLVFYGQDEILLCNIYAIFVAQIVGYPTSAQPKCMDMFIKRNLNFYRKFKKKKCCNNFAPPCILYWKAIATRSLYTSSHKKVQK